MKFPALMGIINVTPDSFSGDGQVDVKAALAHVEQLLANGADIIDIGAESTRPGATPLTAEEEWQRLEPMLPQLIALAHRVNKQVSLDTRHSQTAAQALELGVDIINDVSGCTDTEMIHVLASSSCDIVCMHSLTVPADKCVTMPQDEDVIASLVKFAQERLEQLSAAGINKERVIFDPGIGFAKTPEQSLDILRRTSELKQLGLRLLIGHSRKSFLNQVTNAPFSGRDALTLATSQYLLQHGVDILRVHNVKLHHELFQLMATLHA